jgi:hypothetical protein
MREFTFQTIDDPITIINNPNTYHQYNVKRNRLFNEQFITHKRIRKDKDWQVGEIVNITLSPVAKPHIQLGLAKIISIDKKSDNHYIYPETTDLSSEELAYEGFSHWGDTWKFKRTYFGDDYFDVKIFNKITLQWITWNINMIKIALECNDFRL